MRIQWRPVPIQMGRARPFRAFLAKGTKRVPLRTFPWCQRLGILGHLNLLRNFGTHGADSSTTKSDQVLDGLAATGLNTSQGQRVDGVDTPIILKDADAWLATGSRAPLVRGEKDGVGRFRRASLRLS